MTNGRPSKTEYYFKIAQIVALRSPCSRRKFGAILVKNDTIISTGYNGSVRGVYNCGEEIQCLKDKHKEKSYVSYEHCPAVHAEMNVILNVVREGIISTLGSTLYLAEATGNYGGNDRPCYLCRRMIIQAGIKDIWFTKNVAGNVYKVIHENVKDWVKLENEWIKNEQDKKV